MAHTVIGFFKNATDANNAVDVLLTRGFEDSNVDVAANYASHENTDDSRDFSDKVKNFFRSMFGDDDKANKYSQVARNNFMVTVHAFSNDEAENAADILDECGAIDVDEKEYSGSDADRGYAYSDTDRDFSNTDRDYTVGNTTGSTAYSDTDRVYPISEEKDYTLSETDRDYSVTNTERDYSVSNTDKDFIASDADYNKRRTDLSNKDFDTEKSDSIPIIQEQVQVGKREVRRGGVRVRSRIIEKPVEETLRLREERVRVERTPVDREVSGSDLENFQERTIEMKEYAEEAVVSKKARVVEEVRVGKEVEERNETIRDTERHTEVDVENLSKDRDFDKDRDFNRDKDYDRDRDLLDKDRI